GARQRVGFGGTQRRPLLRPCVVASELKTSKALDIAGESIGGGRRARHVVELRPVERLDRAIAQSVADSLARDARLDGKLGTGTRKGPRASGGGAGRGGGPRLS